MGAAARPGYPWSMKNNKGVKDASRAEPTDATVARLPDEGRWAVESTIEGRHKAKPRRKPRGAARLGRRAPRSGG